MADELFNVLFRGDIAPGQSLADVKARFSQLFKLDAAKVENYFTGKPVVLKRDCDRVTAEKFKAALLQAGALADIKSAVAAQVVAAPVVTAPVVTAPIVAAPVVPVPAASNAVVGESDWSLSARGADLLKPEEIVSAVPVQVSTDHLQVVKRNVFSADAEEALEAPREVVLPALDLSAYQVAKPGETLVPYEEFVPLDLDLSALSLDKAGADLLREDETLPVMEVSVDISGLSLAAPGGDLGQIPQAPPPPSPSTDHLSLEK